MNLLNDFCGFLTPLAISCCCLSLATSKLQADEGQLRLFGFDATNDAQDWVSVNDNVMGGRSEGSFRIHEKGILEFYGNLSLENRGGFASIRSRLAGVDLSKADGFVVRVRGDGRTYYLSLSVPTNRTAFSYRTKFDTQAGRWQEIRLPLEAFQATWFGRTQANAPAIDGKDIRSIGFTLADKKAGPFKLEVDWIDASHSAASAP